MVINIVRIIRWLVKHSIDRYNADGYLSPPIWLWLGWGWLAKTWVVLVMAGVSRDTGSQLLALFYPQKGHLYIELALGLPSLVYMWLVHLRGPDRQALTHFIQASAKPITIIITLVQFGIGVYTILLHYGQFYWFSGLSLMLLLWFGMYLQQSRAVKVCFTGPSKEKG